MQCKDCTHQLVCMHKGEFNRLEGQLPVTDYFFKSAVTCSFYQKETGNIRDPFYQNITGQSNGV